MMISPAFGGGFHIALHDAEAIARGNAVVASIDRPSAVYYNPAALTNLDAPEVQFGLYSVNLGHKTRIGGQRVESDRSWQVVPHFFYAHPINSRWTVGGGLNVPFGLGTDWSGTLLEGFATENNVDDKVLSLTAGYRLTDTISLGAGVNFHTLNVELARAPGGMLTRFKGEDTAFGMIFSAQWRPAREHSFGLTYRTGAGFDLEGSLIAGGSRFSGGLGFDVPDTAAIGYNYRPNSRWEFEVNVEWIRWSQLGTYLIDVNAPIPVADRVVPFEWESSWMYEIGATRHFDNGWKASLGYVYNQNSQPGGPTFTPAVSDADRHWLSAGVGRDTENHSFFLAYQYAFSTRDVAGTAFGAADGKYETNAHTISLEFRYRF